MRETKREHKWMKEWKIKNITKHCLWEKEGWWSIFTSCAFPKTQFIIFLIWYQRISVEKKNNVSHCGYHLKCYQTKTQSDYKWQRRADDMDTRLRCQITNYDMQEQNQAHKRTGNEVYKWKEESLKQDKWQSRSKKI